MQLIYILITMLPDGAFRDLILGLSQYLTRPSLRFMVSETRAASATHGQSQSQPEPSGEITDLASAIYNDEKFTSIFFLSAIALFFLVIVYGFNRYRRYLKSKALTRLPDESDEDLAAVYVSEHNDEFAENTDVPPSYISTDSAPAILVAEENDETRTFVTNTLRLNYRVITAKDGLKAFRKAFEIVPDLIITNASMPGMDGISLCHLLKSTMATSQVPVIILNTERGYPGEAPVPADGCIRANFDARSLLIEIRNFLDQRKHLYSAFRKQVQGAGPVEEYFAVEAAFIYKVNELLKNSYHQPSFGVDDLAEGLSLNRLQLFRKLKVLTNRTPGEYIRNFRVNEAKRLLKRQNSQVSDVAAQSGFANMSGFTKAFKEVTGLSPVEYAVDTRSLTDPVTD